MQPSRSQPRGPGSFAPLSSSSAQPSQLSTSSRPALRRVETSDDEDETPRPSITIPKSRPPPQPQPSSPAPPINAQFTTPGNSSTASLGHHNFSRPANARSVPRDHQRRLSRAMRASIRRPKAHSSPRYHL